MDAANKEHYFRSGWSLCGKWLLAPEETPLLPESDRPSEECILCRMKVEEDE